MFTSLLNWAVSCFMLGVTWLIHVVFYPLYSFVNPNDFKELKSAYGENFPYGGTCYDY